MARTSSVRQYIDAAVHPLQTLMEVDQLATAMGMVRAGLGISLIPALTLFHFAQPGLVTRPLHWPGLTRRIYLVRRRDRSLSLAAQTLYEQVLGDPPREQGPQAPPGKKIGSGPEMRGRNPSTRQRLTTSGMRLILPQLKNIVTTSHPPSRSASRSMSLASPQFS